MSWIAWIVVGLVAGFLAKVVMPGRADEPQSGLGTMLLGIVGAILGGWVWNIVLNRPGATGIDIGSIFVAFIGSCLLIAMLRMTQGRRVA